jgi:hypothetical protein
MLLHDADLPDDRIYSIDKRSGSRKSAITRLTPNGYQVVKTLCSNVARYGGRVDGREELTGSALSDRVQPPALVRHPGVHRGLQDKG